jgi:hypothetical protein
VFKEVIRDRRDLEAVPLDVCSWGVCEMPNGVGFTLALDGVRLDGERECRAIVRHIGRILNDTDWDLGVRGQ